MLYSKKINISANNGNCDFNQKVLTLVHHRSSYRIIKLYIFEHLCMARFALELGI